MKSRDEFSRDLERFYELILERDREVCKLYDLLEDDNKSKKKEELLSFLEDSGLTPNKANLLALILRFTSLQESSFVQVMKKEGFEKKRIVEVKNRAYKLTRDYYIKLNSDLIEKLKEENLLTPFYVDLIEGIHIIGLAFCAFFEAWNAHIIDDVNSKLEERFEKKEDALAFVVSVLNRSDIKEIDERSYYVLSGEDGDAKILSYFQKFKEVGLIVEAIDICIDKISKRDDEVFFQKREFIEYLVSIKAAFLGTDLKNLIKLWREVDIKWMQIKTPLQIGHPLEYYEDGYLKAVAPEWDLRVSNPKYIQNDDIKNSILQMQDELAKKQRSTNRDDVVSFAKKAIDQVQLYIGAPALFYGAEMNGVFSAQVVPNDGFVSNIHGKKIFAFPDRVLESTQRKPFMKLEREVFEEEIVEKSKELIFKKEQIWHEVYKISTIGHEFGHILWVDDSSEIAMNRSGEFKNIEEFKATTGGLVAYMLSEDETLKEYVMLDLIKRSIKLIAWMDTNEVLPYYCEGLLHLDILFDVGAIEFLEDSKKIKIRFEKYEELKSAYITRYSELIEHYLEKKDASEFLFRYLKKVDGFYKPKSLKPLEFVDYYWNLYKEIGQDIDELDSNKNWLDS